MFIQKRTPAGYLVGIAVDDKTKERLSTTCFRGVHVKYAGNFYAWNYIEDFFREPTVIRRVLSEVDVMFGKQEFSGPEGDSLTAIHGFNIGWESTAPIERYHPEDFERFRINRRCVGDRIKIDRVDLRAPKTKECTIVFKFRPENRGSVMIVHSIYPGVDIGKLQGDITSQEKRVFFDWNHPGE